MEGPRLARCGTFELGSLDARSGHRCFERLRSLSNRRQEGVVCAEGPCSVAQRRSGRATALVKIRMSSFQPCS